MRNRLAGLHPICASESTNPDESSASESTNRDTGPRPKARAAATKSTNRPSPQPGSHGGPAAARSGTGGNGCRAGHLIGRPPTRAPSRCGYGPPFSFSTSLSASRMPRSAMLAMVSRGFQ
jgi:hypothetical protein